MRYTRRLCGTLLASILLACAAAGQSAPPAPAPRELTVRGDIAQPITLKAGDLSGMPHETVSVTAEDGSKSLYEGVPLREILKLAGVPLAKDLKGKALASYLLAKAHDGYQVVFSLGEIDTSLGNEPVLIADKRDGKPLTENQGPFRLVCPNDKTGARSVRMLETLEFVRLRK